MTKIVEFIGGSISIVQYHRRSDDVWSVNISGAALEYCKLHWNMDDFRYYGASAEIVRLIREEDTARGTVVPIMTSKVYPEYPNCLEYPLEVILKEFKNEICWFNHTPSYMFPYAVFVGFNEIHLHGFDYLEAPPGIRTKMYMNVLIWIGICAKFGVRVRWNPVSRYLRELYYRDRKFDYGSISTNLRFYGYNPQPKIKRG